MKEQVEKLIEKYRERKSALSRAVVLTPYTIAVNTGMLAATDTILEDLENLLKSEQ